MIGDDAGAPGGVADVESGLQAAGGQVGDFTNLGPCGQRVWSGCGGVGGARGCH